MTRSKEEKTKHTFFLRAGDIDYLGSLFNPRDIPTSQIVRKIISRYVDELRKHEKPIDHAALGDILND